MKWNERPSDIIWYEEEDISPEMYKALTAAMKNAPPFEEVERYTSRAGTEVRVLRRDGLTMLSTYPGEGTPHWAEASDV